MKIISSTLLAGLVLLFHPDCGLSQFTLLSVGHINNGGTASGVAASGSYVYLANLSDGLRVYDVSDPANPVNIFHTNYVGGDATDVAVSGNYVYLANSVDLRIYDVSNPTNVLPAGYFSNSYYPTTLVVTNAYAYINGASDIEIIGVSNPASPSYITARPAGFPASVAVSGSYVYVAGMGPTLAIYDASNVDSPVLVGQTGTAINSRYQGFWVAVSGEFAYLAIGPKGLAVYNITNPAAPLNITNIATGGSSYGVTVDGNYVYLAQDRGVRVFDVSNPYQPVSAGAASTPGQAYGLKVSGDYIYVADSTYGLLILRMIPQLSVTRFDTNTLVLKWPVTASQFVLAQNTDLRSNAWTVVTNPVSLQGPQNVVVFDPSAGDRFFRLQPR